MSIVHKYLKTQLTSINFYTNIYIYIYISNEFTQLIYIIKAILIMICFKNLIQIHFQIHLSKFKFCLKVVWNLKAVCICTMATFHGALSIKQLYPRSSGCSLELYFYYVILSYIYSVTFFELKSFVKSRIVVFSTSKFKIVCNFLI